MRISRLVITAALSLAAIGTVTACGEARPVNSVVPTNISELMSSEPGKSLRAYNYQPVAYLFDHSNDTSKVIGEIYIDCGETTNLTECSNDMHNRGTFERPNVYVVGDKVVALEGPHDSDTDDRSYYAAVPEGNEDKNYQDFAALSDEDQKKLLGIMPAIAEAIGVPSGGEEFAVQTDIGQVNAWVSRSEPWLRP